MDDSNRILRGKYADLMIHKNQLASQINSMRKSKEAEVDAVCNNIKAYITHPKMSDFIRLVVQNNRDLEFDKTNHMILYNGYPPLYKFNQVDFAVVASKTMATIMTIVQNHDLTRYIDTFCAAYNTLLAIIYSADKLKEALTDVSDSSAKAQITRLAAEAEEIKESILREAKEPLGFDEGNIVFGSIYTGYTNEQSEVLAAAGLDTTPKQLLALTAAKHRNSALLKTDIDKNSNIILSYVKSLFFHNLKQYRSGDFLVAMIEDEKEEHRSLYSFSNYLNDAKQRYPLFNPCFYKTTVQEEEGDRPGCALQNGLAKNVSTSAVLLSDIVAELNHRKIASGIREFNRDNPYNHQQYILLLINGFSGLTEETQIQPKIQKDLELILEQGGQYGIYVMMFGEVGTYDVYGQYDKTWTLDAERYGTCVCELDELDTTDFIMNDDELENAIEERAKDDFNSSVLTLADLLKRKDIVIPKAEAEIAIPIGISDNKIYYYATSSDESLSTLKGGNSSLIIGGSGKGKTAFLRSLILSGAWHYSPDDLLFYVLDFKTVKENSAADFRMFEKCSDSRDSGYLQIPHIRFLAMGGNVQSGSETIDLIESIVAERGKIFSKYKVKDCIQYRKQLHRLMQEANVPDYLSYRNAFGEDAMPSMPQIYFLIDEYGSVFSDNKLRKRLDNTVRTIRSFGMSIILSGQNNILENEILANIPNRISFDSSEFSIFRSALDDGTNHNAREILSRLFRKINGKVGHTVCKYNPQQDGTYVQMAYTGNEKESGTIAKAIREKYTDPFYDVIQQKPGNRDAESANSIVTMLQATPSAFIQPDIGVRLYIGITVMTSSPDAIMFESASNAEGIARNYIVLAGTKKQNTIMLNAMVYCTMLLKNMGLSDVSHRISFNYYPDIGKAVSFSGQSVNESRQNIAAETIAENHLDRWISVNQTAEDIVAEINKVYSLLQDRKSGSTDDQLPYFLVLQNAHWLDNCNVTEEKSRKPASNIPTFSLKEDDSSETYIEFNKMHSLIENMTDVNLLKMYQKNRGVLYKIMKDAFSNKQVDVGQNSVDTRFDHIRPLSKLSEILKDGCRFNIFMLFGTENMNLLNSTRDFIRIGEWSNVIIGQKDGVDVEEKEGTCILNNREIRLFDYSNAPLFWKFFNRLLGGCL